MPGMLWPLRHGRPCVQVVLTLAQGGQPLLVKVSYHPRWRADHADGPFLVSPGLMLIVPRAEQVTLTYDGRDASDALGLALSLGALGFLGVRVAAERRSARRPREPQMPRALTPAVLELCEPPPSPLRWGWVVPALLVALLVAAHFAPKGRAGGRGRDGPATTGPADAPPRP